MTFLNMRELETPRLILRKISKKDAEDMYEYAKNPNVSKYLTWSSHESLQYTSSYIKFLRKKYRTGELFDWAIEDKCSHKFIGTCGFSSYDPDNKRVEVGYVLNPLFHGKGFASEAVLCIVDYAFSELGIHRAEARVMDGNKASQRVLEKCGFSFEGTGKDEVFVKGEFKTLHHYSLLNK